MDESVSSDVELGTAEGDVELEAPEADVELETPDDERVADALELLRKNRDTFANLMDRVKKCTLISLTENYIDVHGSCL